MTQNEKFECAIHCVKVMADVELCKGCKAYKMEYSICQEIAMEALKAIEEVQEYRKLGTVEELKTAQRYIYFAKKHGTIGKVIDACAEYEAIGTMEEVREAVEKTTAKKCIEDSCPDHIHYKCPTCGKIQKTQYKDCTFGCILNNCSNCGQKLEE